MTRMDSNVKAILNIEPRSLLKAMSGVLAHGWTQQCTLCELTCTGGGGAKMQVCSLRTNLYGKIRRVYSTVY